jgi:DNA-binding transcriptional ArsR family regulator
MARAATTADVFNAIAEPRRRQIIQLLAAGGGRAHAVGELVETLGLAQPAVSKHLGVLRSVGLVTVSKQGQRRLYALNAEELKPVHDWAKQFEQFWSHQADRIKARAERVAKERAAAARSPHATDKETHKEN